MFLGPLKPIDLSERGDVCRAKACIYVTKSVGSAEADITEAVRGVVLPLAPEVSIELHLVTASDQPFMFWVDVLAETSTGALFHGSTVPAGLCDTEASDVESGRLVGMLRMAAQKACEPLARQLASGAATDEHLLDQLILPASLAHGTSRLLVAEPSLHAQAAIHIAKLLVPEVQISEKRLWDLFLIEIKGIGHCVQADPAVREVAVLAEDAEERRRKRNLQRQFDKKVHELLCLKDTDEGAEGLREALATLAPEVALTLLHGYAVAGRPRLIGMLLDSGACHVDVRRMKDGCTALHIAEYKGHTVVVDVLQAHSADSTLRNKWGETPANAAAARQAGA